MLYYLLLYIKKCCIIFTNKLALEEKEGETQKRGMAQRNNGRLASSKRLIDYEFN